MNIRDLKEGDIVTRNEGCKYNHNNVVDGSYLGDRLILRGHDPVSKIIFFEKAGKYDHAGDITDLSYARDHWDEGWCLYPETLWQKIKGLIKK